MKILKQVLPWVYFGVCGFLLCVQVGLHCFHRGIRPQIFWMQGVCIHGFVRNLCPQNLHICNLCPHCPDSGKKKSLKFSPWNQKWYLGSVWACQRQQIDVHSFLLGSEGHLEMKGEELPSNLKVRGEAFTHISAVSLNPGGSWNGTLTNTRCTLVSCSDT